MRFAKLLRFPKLIIAVCIFVTVFLGIFILKLDIDNSTRLFLPQEDASYKRLEDTEDKFGSMAVLGISIDTHRDSILTAENIQVIRNITDRILEMPDIESIDSLTHIDYVCDTDGTVSASQLIPESYIGSDEDIVQLKSRLAEWNKMYSRVIINDKQNATQMQVSIRILDDEDLSKLEIADSERREIIIESIKSVIEEEIKGKNMTYRIYGDDIITQNARSYMLSDLAILIPIVILVVLITLFFSFKTLDGTILPLITVLMATIQSCGLMSVLGLKFNIVSSVIPVALIAVGSAYGIHVLSHYYVAIEKCPENITEKDYKNAVFAGLEDVKNAVFLAGFTTIIGFISLVSSPIEPLRSFSVFTSAGVAISLILSLCFIPSLLLIKNIDKVKAERLKKKKIAEDIQKEFEKIESFVGKKNHESENSNTLYLIYRFFCGTKARLIVFLVLMTVLSVFGLKKINIETSLIGYFSDKCQMNQDIHYVDKEFAGTNSLHFIVTGPEKGSITNVELLKAVDDMQIYLQEEYPQIGKIVSFTEMLKRINQVWHVPSDSVFEETEFADDMSDDMLEDDFDFGWGFEDFGFENFGFEEIEEAEWTDPNNAFADKLSSSVTVGDFMKMLNDAYVEAGGANASAEKIIKTLESQLNYNGMNYYEVPYDASKYPVETREELKGVVDNYLTLLSGSLDRFLDDEMNPQSMKIQCQLRTHSTKITNSIINSAKVFASENFPEGYTIEATGAGEIESRMTDMVVSSQLISLVISLVCVFLIISVAFKSPIAGFIGAVPLAFTILLNYMIMGFAGINLDLVTSIIASIAVGVGIDYTIHFLTTYKEEMNNCCNEENVTKMTFYKSGRGIISNALAVGFGFLVLCLSKFIVLKYIGVLVAIVMFTSSALAMTIIPGLLNIFKPKFIRPKEKKEN